MRRAVTAFVLGLATVAHAQPPGTDPPAPPPEPTPEPPPAPEPTPEPTPEPEPAAPEGLRVPALQVHGFISEGGFVSTANDYIGASSRGSLALFEAGINVSTELGDRLRAGLQLYGRDVGTIRDLPPRLDWAFIDYRWKPWLGMRAGVIKMPFGLYNEYADIGSARTAILMPQAVYPLHNRSALLAHTGFALYGERAIGASTLEYQAWLGTLNIPENALQVGGATLDGIETKYVTGAQLFWRPPVEGLKIGATFLRTSIDFKLTLDAANTAALIMAGVVPANFDGKLVISQRPDSLVIGSVEYQRENWLFAAEYSRWFKREVSTLPIVLPERNEDAERFYVLATRRLNEHLELGAYASVLHLDAGDRRGKDPMKFARPFYAFQRDYATSLRIDVNDHWLWKLEAHFIDGTADLIAAENPDPKRYWGLLLFKTTVTF